MNFLFENFFTAITSDHIGSSKIKSEKFRRTTWARTWESSPNARALLFNYLNIDYVFFLEIPIPWHVNDVLLLLLLGCRQLNSVSRSTWYFFFTITASELSTELTAQKTNFANSFSSRANLLYSYYLASLRRSMFPVLSVDFRQCTYITDMKQPGRSLMESERNNNMSNPYRFSKTQLFPPSRKRSLTHSSLPNSFLCWSAR